VRGCFVASLESEGVSHCFTDFFLATKVNFLSGERVASARPSSGPPRPSTSSSTAARSTRRPRGARGRERRRAADKLERRLDGWVVTYERRELMKPVLLPAVAQGRPAGALSQTGEFPVALSRRQRRIPPDDRQGRPSPGARVPTNPSMSASVRTAGEDGRPPGRPKLARIANRAEAGGSGPGRASPRAGRPQSDARPGQRLGEPQPKHTSPAPAVPSGRSPSGTGRSMPENMRNGRPMRREEVGAWRGQIRACGRRPHFSTSGVQQRWSGWNKRSLWFLLLPGAACELRIFDKESSTTRACLRWRRPPRRRATGRRSRPGHLHRPFSGRRAASRTAPVHLHLDGHLVNRAARAISAWLIPSWARTRYRATVALGQLLQRRQHARQLVAPSASRAPGPGRSSGSDVRAPCVALAAPRHAVEVASDRRTG
jgi:hypothetical protein